jgi:hypothetical protein
VEGPRAPNPENSDRGAGPVFEPGEPTLPSSEPTLSRKAPSGPLASASPFAPKSNDALDRESPANEHPSVTAPDKTAGPVRRRDGRRWIPWAVIIGAIVIALAIALPLTLGGSSSSASPTPSAPAVPPGSSATQAVVGSYYTHTITGSKLFYLDLVRSGTAGIGGTLAVTVPGPLHKHLATHRYKVVSGSVSRSTLKLTLSPSIDGVTVITGSFESGVITFTVGQSEIPLERGSLAQYKSLVKRSRSALLG